MDESTSALDDDTESEIINEMEKSNKGHIKDHHSCHTVKWMKELNLS